MKTIIGLMLAVLPALGMAQGLVEVEVVNTPLPVESVRIYPSQLRSQLVRFDVAAGKQAWRKVRFDDPQLALNQVSWSVGGATQTGACRLMIRINDVIAMVGKWQPPGSIVGQWQPPGSIVGKWQPPGGIVMSPNDTVVLNLRSVGTKDGDDGRCQAELVVLGTAGIPKPTDGL